MLIYVKLCSGGTEANLHNYNNFSYMISVAPEDKSACSYTASVPLQTKVCMYNYNYIHMYSSSLSTSLYVHSFILECAFEISKCGAEMYHCIYDTTIFHLLNSGCV